MTSALQKQHQKILRNLMKIPSNKKCVDCGEQCAVNVDVTHGTFVCTNCSGIHREFGHRIKSVSMASFTQDEIKMLQETNNELFNQIWMHKWKPDDMALPLNADDTRRRSFLIAKYQDKRWYSKSAAKAVKPSPAAEPITTSQPARPVDDIFGFGAPAPAKPAVQPAQEWSPFGTPAVSKPAVMQQAPAKPKNDLDDLLSLDLPTTQQQQQHQASRNDLKSLVDLMGPSTPQNPPNIRQQTGFSNTAFGQPQPQQNRGFAQPAANTGFGMGFGQPAQTSGFGQPAAQTSGFGQPAAQTSGFGQPAAQTSGFGQPAAQTSGFGQPQGGMGFGQPAAQPNRAFGQPQQSPMFGQPQAQPMFGQPQAQPMGFGVSQPQPGFGQPNVFNQPAQQPKKQDNFDDLFQF